MERVSERMRKGGVEELRDCAIMASRNKEIEEGRKCDSKGARKGGKDERRGGLRERRTKG